MYKKRFFRKKIIADQYYKEFTTLIMTEPYNLLNFLIIFNIFINYTIITNNK